MGISPWVPGQMSPAWTITCKCDTTIFNLTGQLTGWISILFYSVTNPASTNPTYTKIGTGAGVVSIVQADPAIIQYAPAAADTNALTPGVQYAARVEVLFGGTSPDYSDYLYFVVNP